MDSDESDDPYENVQNSCKEISKIITPTKLPNTRNIETNVVQNAALIQEMTIKYCK